jgi:hypothetical protein
VQPLGTERIGRTFGPIMAFWFVAIAALGLWGIAQHPAVLAAVDPRYAVGYLISGGAHAFLVLGAVFLCVTGAEALYADMGYFGARPIRLAWSALVFASLVLNYAGQAAIVRLDLRKATCGPVPRSHKPYKVAGPRDPRRILPAEGEPDDERYSNDGQNMGDPDLRPSRRAGCAALIQCCRVHEASWDVPTVLGLLCRSFGVLTRLEH